MKILKIFPLVVIILFNLRCVPSQHRLDFDLSRNALVSCDQKLPIKHLRIRERDGEGHGYEILLKKNYKGSNFVYLESENEGYYCNSKYPLKFKPNGSTLFHLSPGTAVLR